MAKVILFLDDAPGTTKPPKKQGVRDVPLDRPFLVDADQKALVFKVFEGLDGGLPTAYARKVD